MTTGSHDERSDDAGSVERPAVAFCQALVERLPNLRRFSVTLCRNSDQADDLVQATCARALSRWRQYEPRSRMESWLFAIMHSIWKNEQRSKANRQRAYGELSLAPSQTDGERALLGKIELSEVLSALSALPVDQAMAISLVSLQGLSYREASEVLGVPQGTLESRIARGRIALGRQLDNSESPVVSISAAGKKTRS